MDDRQNMMDRLRNDAANQGVGVPTPSQPNQPLGSPNQPLGSPNQPLGSPTPTPVTNTPVTRSSMEELRAQATSGVRTGTATVSVQGDSYNPSAQSNTTQTPPVNNGTTIINTTSTGSNSGAGGIGGLLQNKMVLIPVVILLAILLFVGLYSSGLLGGGSAVSTEDQAPSDLNSELEWIEPEPFKFTYTPDEVTELRAAGYTGDEIEAAQINEVPCIDLIEMAKEQQRVWYEENVAPLYDVNSDQFNEYVSNTWLALDERTDMSNWNSIASFYVERKNLDYEKIPVYGKQMFLKIYLDDNMHEDYFFLNIDPEQWNKLGDSGNVIVEYTYVTNLVQDPNYPDNFIEDDSSIYIVDATLEIIE